MDVHKPRGGGRFDRRPPHHHQPQPQVNRDLQYVVSKITLPYFDGSDKTSARSWVQNLDNYLSLWPMQEDEAIKFATLHLDGVAHDWWHHGMYTLGHHAVNTYQEFTSRLIEQFDKKEPELYFRKLAQLRQTGSLDSYIGEFQRVAVMVTGISERRLIILFVEGLTEPMRGWVKAFDPPTLQEAMRKV